MLPSVLIHHGRLLQAQRGLLQVEAWVSEAGALHRQCAAVLSDLQTSRQLHDPHCRPPTSLDRLNELAMRLARLRVRPAL